MPPPVASPTWDSYESARQAQAMRSTARRQLRQAQRKQGGGYSPSKGFMGIRGASAVQKVVVEKEERVMELSSPRHDEASPVKETEEADEGSFSDAVSPPTLLAPPTHSLSPSIPPPPRPLMNLIVTGTIAVVACWAFFHFAMGTHTASLLKERIEESVANTVAEL